MSGRHRRLDALRLGFCFELRFGLRLLNFSRLPLVLRVEYSSLIQPKLRIGHPIVFRCILLRMRYHLGIDGTNCEGLQLMGIIDVDQPSQSVP